jgi:tetratricopeptide (TPR) repeat protein/CHAT domain-containing protein
MKSARLIGLILAAMLLVNSFACAPAMAEHDAAALEKTVGELFKAGKFSEAIPLAQRALAIDEKAVGPDNPNVATALTWLALLYKSQGRYADAEPLYKRALAIREKALAPDHPDVAAALNNLAALYQDQGRCADAEPIYKRAMAIREKALPPYHSDIATSLDHAATMMVCFAAAPAIAQQDDAAALEKKADELFKAGKFSEAMPLAQQALAIREKALGPDHLLVATSLNNLADLYQVQGRYADAEPLYKRALAIREKALGPDHLDVATTLNDLAGLYRNQDRYVDAELLLKQALAIFEKALGPDHPAVGTSRNNLAAIYENQGRYADAELLYKQALAIREKALGPDHSDVAQSLNNLGLLYVNQGHYLDAQPLLKRSLAIREKALGRDHPDVAQSLNNLAELYRKQGRYTDAEPLYRRALAIYEKGLGPDHPDVAKVLTNLAEIYRHQGRYADAEPLYKRSLAIFEKAVGPDNSFVATSLNNLAELYQDQGHYVDAEPLHKRALAIYEKALGPDHPFVATLRNNLAALYYDQGRYAEAEPLYKHSLAIFEKALGPDDPNVAATLNNLANLYRAQKRYADALPLVERTVAAARAIQSIAIPVILLAQSAGLLPAPKAYEDALNVVQRASQTATAAAVNKLAARMAAGTGRLAGLVRNDQDLAAEAETLDKAILAAVSKEPAKRDAASEQRIRDRLAEIAKQRAALQGVFAAEFPDYAALSNPQPLTLKDFLPLLSDGEALLLFATGDKESYVFAASRTAAAMRVIPLGTASLSEKVAAFRRGLDVEALRLSAEGGKPVLFDLGLANELYVSLIGPVEQVVKDARHVLVVPAGPLTSLPFHLLVTERPATPIPELKDIASYRNAAWLIKRQAISVLPALASLKALRQATRRDLGTKPMVGFGDPVFDPAERAKALAERRAARARVAVARGYGDFWLGAGIDRAKLARSLPSLLDTADELNSVAAKLGAAPGDIHLGSDASETTVKRTALSDYRVVYFATHGLVAGDIAGLAEPSLALTLPKQPTELDDGLLTASEVAQLKLNADWVVLSACNTAAADKPGAEALSGLARAFFYAGARALLVSHWSVDSEASTRLTTSTFALMKADPKLGRAEALREAMLAYMNDKGSPLNAYPAFWGPFSIIGEGAAR